ncbi:MAG TPA: leucyl aminopeptidase [Anaeromyxobacteraceae bacterium]|jgi:leucyl aminopeptidase
MAALEIRGTALHLAEADLLAVPVFGDEVRARRGAVAALDGPLGGHLRRAVAAESFAARAESTLLLHTLGRLGAARLLLVGMGPRRDGGALEALRAAAGVAARAAGKAGARTLAVAVPDGLGLAAAVRATGEGALLGAYRFDRYLTKRKPRVERVRLVVPRGAERGPGLREEARLAEVVAAATCWARDLVNEPPAACTPSALARAAGALARESGLRCQVRGPRQIAALGMGMFQGVTRGSAEEPRLVKVSWVPKGAGARRRPVVLVGKAITFDSGGLSLKPTESMVAMNTDMAGAAAVVGAMRVVAFLRPPFPVHAVFGACENMPGGRAYKPSDVLRAANGKTVQVTNTDAEGRLVLGDVLSWAARMRPAALVDVATLTGACVVALGQTTAAAMGADGPVVDGIVEAARRSGEDVWRLPLTASLREQLESPVADLKNTGERWGGAITAALFLREFTGDAPWAHLDIAGPSHTAKERGYWAKGGTGVPLRTLVEFVRGWKG